MRIFTVLLSVLTVIESHGEDAIPVIELRGEGKPMSSAQIRHLDEQANGGPLQIKLERRWKPKDCKVETKRSDWVTFHYKLYLEDGRRLYQTYDKDPVTIQIGADSTIKGLDQGLRGICDQEVFRVNVPWRLSQRDDRGTVWKSIPSDEHWLKFDVEIISITPFSLGEQFKDLDRDGDAAITEKDLVAYANDQKEKFGRGWRNDNVDNVLAAKYYIKYFDTNGNGSVDFGEFQSIIERDLKEAESKKANRPKGKKRDPGFGWILDFNNDGVVSDKEIEQSAEIIEKGYGTLKDEL